ncbi:ubiquitin-conjugating enzyme/RWD-like protein [Mycena capillaripes]|nr:ubiquitin-conjugating enzyme/RWD-like protein [Mycena capillaripes]
MSNIPGASLSALECTLPSNTTTNAILATLMTPAVATLIIHYASPHRLTVVLLNSIAETEKTYLEAYESALLSADTHTVETLSSHLPVPPTTVKGIGNRSCSCGLENSDDVMMSHWNGTIIGPGHTVHENRIYSVKITCGDNYPDSPPTVQFLSRVNLPFVSATNGNVDPSRLPVLAGWSRASSFEHVLVEIRKNDDRYEYAPMTQLIRRRRHPVLSLSHTSPYFFFTALNPF